MDLVTGGTGIVGAHLLIELVRQQRRVRALRRPHSSLADVERVFKHYGEEGQIKRIEWVEGDLLDVVSLRDAMSGVELVYHAAALVSFNPRRVNELHAANVTGTANVVNAALEAGVKRMLHVSSTAAIGSGADGQMRDEGMAWSDAGDVSAYARSKHLAEIEVHRGIAEGLDAVIVNPSVVIGPGPSGRSSMTIVERLRRGTRWYTRGSNAFVDARDAALCMTRLMEAGATGERYLLVGENASYRKLFNLLSDGFGHARPGREARPWMLHLARHAEGLRALLMGSDPLVTAATVSSSLNTRAYSNAKASDLLGYRFRALEESVANAVSFAKAAG
ncbi:MAG: NAD-dependent epimerase/dehydratase family protein [Flavobacteriales bacterium]|nr:NAD-dependent epimerase/dehydratase family protein [Flavobacteriales bacterium]